ncbi:uncharacterized protein LOC144434814 [Glandiceps talaboti]
MKYTIIFRENICEILNIFTQEVTRECCPGWEENDGRCNVPICNEACENGGTCVAPDTCQCLPYFQGTRCNEAVRSCDKLVDTCTEVCEPYHHRSLPHGCYSISSEGQDYSYESARCTQPHLLVSNLPWYRHNNNETIYFTQGVVYVDDGKSRLPISLHGADVHTTGNSYTVQNIPTSHNVDEGSITIYEEPDNCDVSSSYINQVPDGGALLSTFINAVKNKFPSWFKIHSLRGGNITTATSVIKGHDIVEQDHCYGAPLDKDRLYTVFRFESPIAFSVYDDYVCLPEYVPDTVICLITEHCGDSIFLQMPGSASLLSDLKLVKTLSQIGINTNFVALGFSRTNRLSNDNVNMDLWNGDHIFEYQQPSGYAIWSEVQISNENRQSSSDIRLTVSSNIKLMLAVDDFEKILSHSFLDRVDGLLNIAGEIELKFKVFGNQVSIPFVQTQVMAYLSFGGFDRNWCEDPPGLFMKAWMTASPFGDSILSDMFADSELAAYFFVTHGGETFFLPNDDINEDLKSVLVAANELANTSSLLAFNSRTSSTFDYIQNIQHMATDLGNRVHTLLTTERSGNINAITLPDQVHDLRLAVDEMTKTWEERSAFQEPEALGSLISDISQTLFFIRYTLDNIGTQHITNFMNAPNIMDVSGFGLKFRARLNIYGLDFGKVGVEFMKSNMVGRCDRFSQLYEDIAGKDALMGRITLTGSISLKKFLTVEVGNGNEFALSTNSQDFLFGFTSSANLLGIQVETNLFVNDKFLYFQADGKIWDICYATFSAQTSVFVPWEEQRWKITGEFGFGEKDLPKTMTEAMKDAASKLAQQAVERIENAQKYISNFQEGVQSSISQLEAKKEDVQRAHHAFDEAMRTLEAKTNEVENAKAQVEQAIERLRETQRNIDKICVIATCSDVCIPGLKCRWCYKKIGIINRFPYPCCRKDSCMISFKDPACVISNIACHAARKIALVGLKIAEGGAELAIGLLDFANFGLDFARMVVDRSRCLLDVAETSLDIAQGVLTSFINLLEFSERSLEVLKIAVNGGLAIARIIINGIGFVIDIESAKFEVEFSSGDQFILEVEIGVDIFRTGLRHYTFHINFKDFKASTATIAKSIVKTHAAIAEVTNVRPSIPGTPFNDTDVYTNGTSHQNVTYFIPSQESEYLKRRNQTRLDEVKENEFRIATFEEKCQILTNTSNFIKDAFEVLHDVALDSKANDMNASEVLHLIDEQAENLSIVPTFDVSSVNLTEAFINYNISIQDIENEVFMTSNLTDTLTNETNQSIEFARKGSIQEYETASDFKILGPWKEGMENVTNEAFASEECSSFDDCLIYSFDKMLGLYDEVDLPEVQRMRDRIRTLREKVNVILANDTLRFNDAEELTREVLDILNEMENLKIFCATPPEITEHPKSMDVQLGDNVKLTCAASGDPEPRFWWYKNDELLATESLHTLIINNIDMSDVGFYWCMAGNHVINVSSQPALINVYLKPSGPGIGIQGATILEGQEPPFILSCHMIGIPLPNITWSFSQNARNYDVVGSGHELVLTKPRVDQRGWYTCEAVNIAGRSISNDVYVEILKISVPVPTMPFSVTAYWVKALQKQAMEKFKDAIKHHMAMLFEVDVNRIQSIAVDKILGSYEGEVRLTLVGENKTTEDVGNRPYNETKYLYDLAKGDLLTLTYDIINSVVEEDTSFEFDNEIVTVKTYSLEPVFIEPTCPEGQGIHDQHYFICAGVEIPNTSDDDEVTSQSAATLYSYHLWYMVLFMCGAYWIQVLAM